MHILARLSRAQRPTGVARMHSIGQAGFTLVELLVVLVILVLLASLVAPRVVGYLGSSRTKAAKVQIESLSTALELFKVEPAEERLKRPNQHVVAALLDNGNFRAEAIAALDSLLSTSDNDEERAGLLVRKGVFLEADKKYEEARQCYEEAVKYNPNSYVVLNNLAYLLGKDPARLDEAVALAERAYRAAPRSPAVADTLGWLLYQNGALERAETLLGQAAGGAPDNPEIRYHLGLVYAKRGKKEEARREIERALEAPNFAGADEARRTLESIR